MLTTVLNVAQKEVGVLGKDGHQVKYNDEFYGRPVKDHYEKDKNGNTVKIEYHWCTVFVWWVFKHANSLLDIGNIKTENVQNFYDQLTVLSGVQVYKNISDAKPGDIFFIHYNSKTLHHTGLVYKNRGDGSIITIEGNTSEAGSLNSDNHGNGVHQKVREKSGVMGGMEYTISYFVRPLYAEYKYNPDFIYYPDSSLPPVGQPMPDFPLPSGWVFAKGGYQSYNGITDDWGPYIEFIQEALNLTADGRFGEATHQAVLAFQAQRGLSQDGKVGKNTWNALREKRDGGSSSGGSSSGYDDGSIYTGAFKLPSGHCYGKLGIAYASHNGHENASDRPAIRGIQRKLGLSADGLFGNGTYNAVVSFQTKYGLTADGKVGPSTWRSIIFNTDGGSVYGGNSFLLPRGHCYGKLGINYASHNGYENSSDRPAIRKIQQRLGLYSDGLFGSGTHSAVVAFQRSRGLTADGKVGPGTWNKMF